MRATSAIGNQADLETAGVFLEHSSFGGSSIPASRCNRSRSVWRAVLFSALTAATAFAQSAPPAFEVATIKPSPQLMIWSGFQFPNSGRFEASHVTLQALVAYSYDVRDFYVSGGPGWASSDRFEIVAKTDVTSTRAQVRMMLRTLIEERFKLALHRETKTAMVYELAVSKGQPKLEESVGDGFLKFQGRGQVDGQGVTMTGLASYLQTLLGQVVLDKTGLKGSYNFKLAWTPDEAQAGRPGAGPVPGDLAGGSGPSIFTALEEQLGLRLRGTRGPVETIVIDHAEKPSEN